jgi:hypothetical protein
MLQIETAQNMRTPIHAGFGRLLQQWHSELIADTPGVVEYKSRPFAEAAAWAPGRMSSAVMDIISAMRKDDPLDTDLPRPRIPRLIVTADRSFVPTPSEVTRQTVEWVYCRIPDDPKRRIFQIRVPRFDINMQLVIVAQEWHTAHSLAMQLYAFLGQMEHRRFQAEYVLAGIPQRWPVMVETPEIIATPESESGPNLTIIRCDLNLRCGAPMLRYPAHGSPDADGKGAGTVDDPDGFIGVNAFDLVEVIGEPDGELIVMPVATSD